MCTPIGHSLAACSVVYATRPTWVRHYGSLILVVIVAGNLPDIDLIFGSFVCNPNLYHHLWTHSITFCIMGGLLGGLGYRLLTGKDGLSVGSIIFLVMLSHLILDFFARDTNTIKGIQLFWPFSERYYISPVSLFREVQKSSANSTFIQSLFCWHNVYTIFIEIAILSPILILLWFKKRFRRNRMVTD